MVDDDSHGPGRGGTGGSSRSLKTAASVLRALRLLGSHPRGLSCQDLGRLLGKSPSTARYMINTLCEAECAERAPDGRWRLTASPPWGPWDAADGAGHDTVGDTGPGRAVPTRAGFDPLVYEREEAPHALLAEAVTELYRRTRQRSYLVRRSGVVIAAVSDVRGHQGLARLPGLGDHVPPRHAHALAMTKVLLAASPSYLEAVSSEPLEALTGRTLTTVTELRREIDAVRRRGHGVDDGEFADGFATVAAPVRSPGGDVTVALGLSTSTRRRESHAEELVAAVVEVAAEAGRQWAALLGCGVVGAALATGTASAAHVLDAEGP